MTGPLACGNCGAREPSRVLAKLGLVIVRCLRCSLVYVDPRLSKEDLWTRYNPRYFHEEYLPSLGVIDGRFDLTVFDARYHALLDLLGPPRNGQLLEVGAGAGFLLKAAERRGWQVTGLEVSEEAVRFAREELGLDVRQQVMEEANFPDGSFQAAAMMETIEHLLDPLAVLHGVRRALAHGSPLILSTPNYDALSRLALGPQWAVLTPLEHVYYFTEKTLRSLLTHAGFERITFHRHYAGFGVFETMNPRCTHAPDSQRARLYLSLVSTVGPFVYRWVQASGRGDTLFCVAYAS